MYEAAKVAGYLLSPLTVVLMLWLAAGGCAVTGRRRLVTSLAALGFAILYVASLPVVAQALSGPLETRFPALTTEATPAADAIVILGGAVAGRHPPQRPFLGLHSASSRVWHAAELYRAGKARWIVVAAGGKPEDLLEQVEAEAIAEMLTTLGVPANAIKLEGESRNTWQNAANIRPILEQLRVRRILLVTSAQHMQRAITTFRAVWTSGQLIIIPAPTDQQIPQPLNSLSVWIPSPNGLADVTKALREYAGMVALAIM